MTRAGEAQLLAIAPHGAERGVRADLVLTARDLLAAWSAKSTGAAP